MEMPSTKVIEHPDIFIRESNYDYSTFTTIMSCAIPRTKKFRMILLRSIIMIFRGRRLNFHV